LVGGVGFVTEGHRVTAGRLGGRGADDGVLESADRSTAPGWAASTGMGCRETWRADRCWAWADLEQVGRQCVVRAGRVRGVGIGAGVVPGVARASSSAG
jgi:hypothetical protein